MFQLHSLHFTAPPCPSHLSKVKCNAWNMDHLFRSIQKSAPLCQHVPIKIITSSTCISPPAAISIHPSTHPPTFPNYDIPLKLGGAQQLWYFSKNKTEKCQSRRINKSRTSSWMSDIIPRGDTNLQGFVFRLGIQYFLPITPPTLAPHRQRLLLLLLLLLLNCSRGSKINSTSAVACQCRVLWWFVVLYTCLLFAASSFTPALQQHRPTADHHYSNDRVGRDQRRQQ